MPFVVGDRYTIGPGFQEADIQNMAPGTTRETVLVVSLVNNERDNNQAIFVREQDGVNFWPNLPNHFWPSGLNWFIPVPEYYLLFEPVSNYIWRNRLNSSRMTLQEARDVIAADGQPDQILHLIPLRSVRKFEVDAIGSFFETNYQNINQAGV